MLSARRRDRNRVHKRWLGVTVVILALLATLLYLELDDPSVSRVSDENTLPRTLQPPLPTKQHSPREMTRAVRLVANPAPLTGIVRGYVYHPNGTPAAGATVNLVTRTGKHQLLEAGSLSAPLMVVPTELASDTYGFFEGTAPLGTVAVLASSEDARASAEVDLTTATPVKECRLVLQTGLAIKGRVITARGEGVADAQVEPLVRVRPKSHLFKQTLQADRLARATRTNQSGDFRINALVSGDWRLFVTADGYGSTVSEVVPAGTSGFIIVLTEACNLECRIVMTPDESPLGSVNVRLQYPHLEFDSRSNFIERQSDQLGIVEFSDLGPGDYTIGVRDRDFVSLTSPVQVTIPPGGQNTLVELKVTEGSSIRGRLTDKVSDRGIAGQVITASRIDGERGSASSPTGEDGTYILGGLAPGLYVVRPPLNHPLYPWDGPTLVQKEVTVEEAAIVDGVDFALDPKLGLAGVVLSEGNEPVPGASVRVVNAEATVKLLPTMYTGKDGAFRIGGFEAGQTLHVYAESLIANSGVQGPFVAGGAGSDSIRLRLDISCGAMIGGRVINQHGEPVECLVKAIGSLEGVDTFLNSDLSADADGNGNFLIADVCPGEYVLQIVPRSNWIHDAKVVRVASSSLLGLQLVYNEGEVGDIDGLVVGADATPVADAIVEASPEYSGDAVMLGSTTRTDNEGVFRFSDMPEGAYQISARAVGHPTSTTMRAETGESNVLIELIPAPIISGWVVDSDGHPVPDYSISLWSSGSSRGTATIRRIHSVDGYFELELPFGASWILEVDARGFAISTQELGSIPYGGERTDIFITLHPESNT